MENTFINEEAKRLYDLSIISSKTAFIEGAMSDVTKEYWQQGMYSKKQIVALFEILVVRGCFRGTESKSGRNYDIAIKSVKDLLNIDYEAEIDDRQ